MENTVIAKRLFAAFLLVISGILAVGEFATAKFAAVRSVITTHFAALVAVIMIGTLSGCSAWRYPGEEYGNVESISFEHAGETWKIFDKPEKNRLLISHAWYGISGHYTYAFYRNAVNAYLKSKGNGCKAETASKTTTGFTGKFEVEYDCSEE